MPGEANHVDDAALPVLRQGSGVRGIAHAVVALQLDDEVVRDFFILCHLLRTAAFRDRFGDVWIEPALQRGWVVRIPHVLLRPVTCRDENDEL